MRTVLIMCLVLAAPGCKTGRDADYPKRTGGPCGLYIDGKNLEESAGGLRKALKKNPGSPVLHYLYADARYLEGDFEAAAAAFAEAVEHASKQRGQEADIIAQNGISTIESVGQYVPGYDEMLKGLLDSVLGDLYRNSDGAYFAALAAEVKRLRRRGEFEAAEEAGEKGGCLQSWLKIGPFGDTDLMSFDESHPPETELPWREIYTMREGESPTAVRSADTESCWTTLGAEGFRRGGAFYGLHRLHVAKKTDLIFKLTSFDPTSLMIDGVEIAVIDRRKDIHPNSVLVSAALEPGIHYVTVKLSSRSTMPAFMLIVKEASASRPELGPGSAVKPASPSFEHVPVAAPPSEFGIEAYDIPDTELGRILLADIYILRGVMTEARRALGPLKREHPGSFAVGSRMLIVDALDSYLPYSIRMNRTKAEAGRMKKHHRKIWLPYIYLSMFEAQAGRLVNAIDILREGMEKSPVYHGFIVELADTYEELGWSGEAIEALRKASQRLEGTCSVFTVKYRLAEKYENPEEMEKYAKLMQGCDRTDRTYLSVLLQKDEWKKALGEQRALLEGSKGDRWLLVDTGWSSFKTGDAEGYKEALHRSLEENPSTLSEAIKLADLSARHGDESEAKERLLMGIVRNAGPPSLVQQDIASIEGTPYLFHYRRSFEEAVASFNTIKKASYKDTPAIEVLDHVTHRLYGDGSSLTRYHSIKKLLTREAVEKNGEFDVPENALLMKIHTIKPDGTVLEPEKIYGKPTVSYPSLEPGDYTETEWVQYLPPSTIFPGGTFLDRWYFQVPDLVLHRSEMYLIVPEGMEVDLNPRGSPVEPTVTNEKGLRIYKWEVLQNPHIKYEPNSPHPNEVLPSLQVTLHATWDVYEKWVRDLLVDTFIVTPEMREGLKEILEGVLDDDIPKKTETIYRWVCDEVQSEEGLLTPVSHIYHQKRGDKVKLLYSFLREAGVPAELHLAETVYADKTLSDVPDFNKFTHFIVRAGDDWLMPMFKKAHYGFIPYALFGQKTKRIFPEGGGGTIPGSDLAADGIEQDLHISVDGDGETRSRLSITFEGPRAAALRETLRAIPKGELKMQVESTYLADIFPGAVLTSLSIPNMEEPSRTLEMILEFTKPPQDGPLPGSVVIGPILKSRIAAQWTQLPERNFPLLIDENIVTTTHVEIDGQGMWKIMPPPDPDASAKAEGGKMKFEQKVEIDEKGAWMTLDRKLVIPMGRVAPSRYEEFLEFAGNVDESEGGVYLLLPVF